MSDDTRLTGAADLIRQAIALTDEVRDEIDDESPGWLALLRTRDHLARAESQLRTGIRNWVPVLFAWAG